MKALSDAIRIIETHPHSVSLYPEEKEIINKTKELLKNRCDIPDNVKDKIFHLRKVLCW